jgi:hypothetical protein
MESTVDIITKTSTTTISTTTKTSITSTIKTTSNTKTTTSVSTSSTSIVGDRITEAEAVASITMDPTSQFTTNHVEIMNSTINFAKISISTTTQGNIASKLTTSQLFLLVVIDLGVVFGFKKN